MIGQPAERCPWRWEQARDLIEAGNIELRRVGHCPFCGGFFDVDQGWPRKRTGMGGRRFGTATCEEAWEQDMADERRAEHRTRELIKAHRNGAGGGVTIS